MAAKNNQLVIVTLLAVLFFGIMPNFAHATVCGTESHTQNDTYDLFGNQALAVKVTMTSSCNITSVDMNFAEIGSPAARPLYIYNDSAGAPGTILATGGNVTQTHVYPVYGLETSTFDGTVCIASGTIVYVDINVDGSDSAGSRFIAGISDGGSSLLYKNGGTWHTTIYDGIANINGTVASCGGSTASPFSRFVAYWW